MKDEINLGRRWSKRNAKDSIDCFTSGPSVGLTRHSDISKFSHSRQYSIVVAQNNEKLDDCCCIPMTACLQVNVPNYECNIKHDLTNCIGRKCKGSTQGNVQICPSLFTLQCQGKNNCDFGIKQRPFVCHMRSHCFWFACSQSMHANTNGAPMC